MLLLEHGHFTDYHLRLIQTRNPEIVRVLLQYGATQRSAVMTAADLKQSRCFGW